MTSAVRTINHSRGFTLLEIIMVLGVAAMVMGGAVGLMIYSADERTLRDASTQIELLAKRARTISILQQTPYALEIRTGIVRLMPLARAGADEKTAAAASRTFDDDEAQAFEDDRQVLLRDGMEISIRRWNSDKWFPTGKNTVHVWRFDPDGLCEPVSIRLNLEKSWSEDTYHPLTATIRDSQLEAR